MSYGLCRRLLVDLTYLKEPAVNAFQVVSFTRKIRHFQPSVKKWEIIKHMVSKQQFLHENLSNFKSTLHSDLLIECQIKHIVRKKLRAVFACHHSLMTPCKNSMLRPGYRNVRFLDTMCTVGMLRTYCHSICAEVFLSTLHFMFQENAPSWQCVVWMENVRMLVLFT